MSLAAGTRLGPYEVLALIGAGGMGEVYKAKDTRLDRTVAIKVLSGDISSDPNRRARFEREAKTIAALSHPHICTVHDVGEYAGSMFLVMERLEGETLAARLARGPLPVGQALTIAAEVTEALAAAHRQGVIHRDLKPSNVMLTRSGAKLLDFGLAKLTAHGEQPPVGHLASASTQSTPLTAEGVIAGTLQYMAPEQLEGKPADARTDLWTVGALIYEMVTGKRAFEGASAVSLIGAILEREPVPIGVLQPLTPPALERAVRQCLAKSPDDRPDTAHDLANSLRWIQEGSGVGTLAPGPPARTRWSRLAIATMAAIVLTAAITSWVWTRWRPPVAPAQVVRSELGVSPAEELNAGTNTGWAWMPAAGGSRTAFAWTPDGGTLLFVGRRGGSQQLYARALARDEARPLPGTEGAKALAVSPDGQFVAFWAHATLKKVSLAGGPVVDLVAGIARPPAGLVWDASGNLYFGRAEDGRIWKVSADGTSTPVTTAGRTSGTAVLPWPLPGGDALLYTVRTRDWSWGDEEIVAQRIATGERKVLLRDGADARYLDTGHLLFLRRGVLFAVPFDPDQLEVLGSPVAILDEVVQALTGIDSYDLTGAGQFAVAPTGALAWLRGPVVPYLSDTLVSVDHLGRVSPLAAPKKSYVMGMRLAPGGRQVAVAVRDLNEVSLWTHDLARGVATPLPIARGGEAYLHAWTRDGQRLVFHWLRDRQSSLALLPADGTSPPAVLGVGASAPSSWAPDGRRLVVVTDDKDLAVVTIENGRAAVSTLQQTPHVEAWPDVSADGRWLAYASNDSGRNEVYVQPFQEPGPRMQVSIDGGESPAWGANGRELFYVGLPDAAGKRGMKVVRFESGPPAAIGTAQTLFEFDPRELKFVCGTIRCFDITADGQRFYVVQTSTPPAPPVVTEINLVQNWTQELKAKVPGTPR